MTFKAIGVSRHRIGTDGVGVTTLVGGHGCPLNCKYCLNPQCKSGHVPYEFTIPELYERLRIDSLYFTATGGGVTFGGGEPLLQTDFIREFILYCKERGEEWRFTLETCLAVSEDRLGALDGLIDEYVVDIKDMNDEIYRAYTERDSSMMKKNLSHLASVQENVIVKTPLIPNFNTAEDTLHSRTQLETLGFSRFERFKYITEIKKVRDLSKKRVDSIEKT